MINYLKADFMRIVTKKGMYVYFAILFVLYLVVAFIQARNFNVAGQAQFVFQFVGLMGGGYLFSSLYNDDLHAKSLPQLIGFGKKRGQLVLCKLILNTVFSAVLFVIGGLLFQGTMAVLGIQADSESQAMVTRYALTYGFSLVAYSTVASVLVYGTQKATVSIVAFVLLASGFISQILFLVLNMLGDFGTSLFRFTLTPIVANLAGEFSFGNLLSYLLYIGIFGIIAVLAFSKKDLEF